jgi:predicted small secreted protein
MKAGLVFSLLALAAVLLTSCETVDRGGPDRAALSAAIASEPRGDYFIGRRMYKKEYKMWGWVREPGRPWSTARLVMMNEQLKLAPDREGGKMGTDNNFEYRLRGRFTGETVYEPASDRFYPEFQLTGHELISRTPPQIYVVQRQEDPEVRILAPPPY